MRSRSAGKPAPQCLKLKKKISDLGAFLVQLFCYPVNRNAAREVGKMRGYYSTTGFWGLVDGSYRLFASEEDYYDSMTDEE